MAPHTPQSQISFIAGESLVIKIFPMSHAHQLRFRHLHDTR